MAQGSGRDDPEVKAQRKLAKAQLKLHMAEEKHAQMREKGKQEIEKARLRAARWLARSAKRVEQRASAVMRAEERLALLTDVEAAPVPDQPLPVENEALAMGSLDNLPSPAPAEAIIVQGETGDGMGARDLRALQALHRAFHGEGITAREWRLAAEMPETTFARARKALLDGGLVARDGENGRDARYSLTDAGQEYAEDQAPR